jgi:hypothetical protein
MFLRNALPPSSTLKTEAVLKMPTIRLSGNHCRLVAPSITTENDSFIITDRFRPSPPPDLLFGDRTTTSTLFYIYRQILIFCILEPTCIKYVQAVRITAKYLSHLLTTALHMRRFPPRLTSIQTTELARDENN